MEQNKTQKISGTEFPVNTDEVRRKKRKRIWISVTCVICSVVLLFVGVLSAFQIGCWYNQRTLRFWTPDYERVDISELLQKETLTDEEYELLYRQTGLTKLGIDGLLEDGNINQILKIQDFFFTKQEVIIERFNPFTYDETIDAHAPMAKLENGDILVTATTRVSWWRYGHAALVVDGAACMTVESIAPGTVSQLNAASEFDFLADFMILRPKFDAEFKNQVATFARENLIGIPYRFSVGVLSKKFNPDEIKASQCAHLVWYAYRKFGVDLDSDGKGIVKPQDMALSEHVEVVQAYGFDLDTLWS